MPPVNTDNRYHHGDLRNALLVAAEQLVTEKGVAGLSLREVAKLAGVSHAAPYRHFRDKAALVRGLAQAGFERLASVIGSVKQDKSLSPEQKLVEAGVACVQLAVQNPEITRLMFGGLVEDRGDAVYRQAYGAAYALVLDIVEAGIRQGTFRPRAPQELTMVAWASMHGMAMFATAGLFELKGDDPVTLAQQVRQLAGNVIYGIAR